MLYLVQHGEAVSKEINADRPLSIKGVADVTRLAAFLASTHIQVGQVFHSGKTRAKQTADVLAGAIQQNMKVEKMSGINPNDPVDVVKGKLNELKLPVMIVGHLPFMSRLVSHLVTQHDDLAIVNYDPGCVVCLEKGINAGWLINWILRPELFVDKNTR